MRQGPKQANTPGEEARPYPPSWLDRLIAWIIRLPGPSWLAYVVMFFTLSLLNTAIFWFDGSLDIGDLDIARIAEISFFLFLLPFTHYLDNVAENVLTEFSPILRASDDRYATLKYQLKTLPRRTGWLSIGLGLPLAGLSIVADPASWQISASSSLLLKVTRSIEAGVFATFSIAFLLHTIHQLRMVDRLQSMAPDISLFHTRPVYALSALTARTGIGIAMFVYWVAYLNYGLEIFGPQAALSVIDLSITGLLLLTSIGAFVIPLLGMHERLVKEKNRALYEVNVRIELAIARLHAKVDSTSADETDVANKNLESLLLEAETVSKKSTWPWSPETLRTFLGAIALPVIVWLITTALDRFILD